jgi:hypothetical protein
MNQYKKKIIRPFNKVTKRCYQWRYWDHLYRNMKKQIQIKVDKEQNQFIPYINKPGIVFSFDDSYRINDWYNYGKDLFGFYDVRVTFNINAFHHFEGKREHSQKEIDMLLDLQFSGHEIAHHGFNHKKVSDYTKQFGMKQWVEDEIINLFKWTDLQKHSQTLEKFKRPVSFVFPHFVYTEQHISELVPKYFKIVRGHLDNNNLVPNNYSGFAASICLDGYYSKNLFYIKKIIRLAKKAGKNVIFTCHSILPDEKNWGDYGWGEESINSGTWRTSPKTIKAIIEEARKLDMEFYTTSDIAGVATFMDQNFEECVRKLLSNSNEKWISILKLIDVKELDLSHSGISNIDGIQYFINLEKLNLSNNNIADFRLLEKLPSLKVVDISNNPGFEGQSLANKVVI